MSHFNDFFSWKGRIRRRTYLWRGTALIMLCLIAGEISGHYLMNFIILAGLILFTFQTIKRLHDLNRSGWWILCMPVPILNILMGTYVLFRKGTPITNRYGAAPDFIL